MTHPGMVRTAAGRSSCAVGGLVVVAMAVACSQPPPEPKPVIRPVRTEEVFATGSQRIRNFTGIARASTESRLSFKVSGTVERVPVTVGDRVVGGQVLAAIEATDLELQVQQAEQSLRRAAAEAKNAAANLDRVRQLYENNNAARHELDAADAAAESTAAAVGSSNTALRLARQQLSYATLRAPIAGSIAAVYVEVNENLGRGQTVLLLTSGSRAEVEVGVAEMWIGHVREGSAAEVRFDALPERSFAATVTEVGVSSAGMETMFPVTVRLDQGSAEVRPGMAAEVGLRFGTGDDREVILVPLVAVSQDRDGRFVLCVEPTGAGDGMGTVERRKVEVGSLVGNAIEVLVGLEHGDRVITAGVSRIHHGMTVRVAEFGR